MGIAIVLQKATSPLNAADMGRGMCRECQWSLGSMPASAIWHCSQVAPNKRHVPSGENLRDRNMVDLLEELMLYFGPTRDTRRLTRLVPGRGLNVGRKAEWA